MFSVYSNSNDILKLVEWTLVDTTYILRLMYELNVIPLALQITNICGNIMVSACCVLLNYIIEYCLADVNKG